MRCKSAKHKGGFGSGVPTDSLMIKSAKGMEKRRKGISRVGVAYLSLVGSPYFLYSNFFLIIGKIIS